eukprot:gene11688-24474_t
MFIAVILILSTLSFKIEIPNRLGLSKFVSFHRSLPEHVAFIVDGNGRWAQNRGLSRLEGHIVGAKTTVDIVKYCFETGVSTVTLYLFSTENWKRSSDEVSNIMTLLEQYLMQFTEYFKLNDVAVTSIGQFDRLPLSIQRLLNHLESSSSSSSASTTATTAASSSSSSGSGVNPVNPTELDNTKARTRTRTLCLAISYGGRDDIVQTCRSLASSVRDRVIVPEDIDETLFQQYTSTGRKGMSDPDLVVRTSGEFRLSNFLLWQCAYSEFVAVDCLWPDFNRERCGDVFKEYGRRDRRYGG